LIPNLRSKLGKIVIENTPVEDLLPGNVSEKLRLQRILQEIVCNVDAERYMEVEDMKRITANQTVYLHK
jgi:hypothetical protein